jgi:hypothetical protein
MKVCKSGRQSTRLALVSVIVLVLLGVLSCRHKERQQQPAGRPLTTLIPMCNAKHIVIQPGGTDPPTPPM